MFERILRRMREKVRRREYVVTLHGEEEMDDEGITAFDVESGILNGSIIERQKDRRTGEWKYVVRGQTLRGEQIAIVAKLSPTGKLVMLTVYLD